jgi:hypothetical protein
MKRLNQTEPATFSIMTCWAFFRDSYFLYFTFSGPSGSLMLSLLSVENGVPLKPVLGSVRDVALNHYP